MRWASPLLRGDTVLLLNGDSYCDASLSAFREFHAGMGAAASVVLARVADASRFGQVRVGEGGQLVRFAEKGAARGAGWINAGVYLFARRLVETIPQGRGASLERDLLPGWVAQGQVAGYCCPGRFLDIGTPESYAVAEDFFRAPALITGR